MDWSRGVGRALLLWFVGVGSLVLMGHLCCSCGCDVVVQREGGSGTAKWGGVEGGSWFAGGGERVGMLRRSCCIPYTEPVYSAFTGYADVDTP
jgi:hypothetical protein